MSVQENIEIYKAAKNAVVEHCMCAKLEESGSKAIVYFPEGDFPVGGIRIDRTANGFKQALERMEKFWLASYPGFVA